MRLAWRLAGTLAAAVLAAGTATAEPLPLQDYPNMGNVKPGCSGVSQCIVYLAGAGNATVASIQTDLFILTAGMPSGVGIIAYKASGYVYSDSDITQFQGDVSGLSQQFGSQLSTVCVSDGVRVLRDSIDFYGQDVGPLFQIDQFTAPTLSIPLLDPTRNYVAVVAYSGDYSPNLQILYSTGPSPFYGSSPYYPIVVVSELSIVSILHETAITLGLSDANAALIPAMSNNLAQMRNVLQAQFTNQAVPSPTASGTPGVSLPPQGTGPSSPSQGGGVGMESRPAWLGCKGAPHVPPS